MGNLLAESVLKSGFAMLLCSLSRAFLHFPTGCRCVRSAIVRNIHAMIIVVKPCEKNNSCGTSFRIRINGIVEKAKGRWNEEEGALNKLGKQRGGHVMKLKITSRPRSKSRRRVFTCLATRKQTLSRTKRPHWKQHAQERTRKQMNQPRARRKDIY